MSGKTITVINAANIYARNFVKTLRGYDRIILGDIYNNRRSVLILLFLVPTIRK